MEGRGGTRGSALTMLSATSAHAGRGAPGEFAALMAAAAASQGGAEAVTGSDSLTLAPRGHALAADLPWDALADAADLAGSMMAPLQMAAMAMGLGPAPNLAPSDTATATAMTAAVAAAVVPTDAQTSPDQRSLGATAAAAALPIPAPMAADPSLLPAASAAAEALGLQGREGSATPRPAANPMGPEGVATAAAAALHRSGARPGPLGAGESAPAATVTAAAASRSSLTTEDQALVVRTPASRPRLPATEAAMAGSPAAPQDQVTAAQRLGQPAMTPALTAPATQAALATDAAHSLAIAGAVSRDMSPPQDGAVLAAAAEPSAAAPGLTGMTSRRPAVPADLALPRQRIPSPDTGAADRRQLPQNLADLVNPLLVPTEQAAERRETVDRLLTAESVSATPAVSQSLERLPSPTAPPMPAPAQPGAHPAIPPRVAAEAGHQVALRMARAAANGVETISVDLRPPELGRVEVRMTFRDGMVQVVMAAERAETFEAFRQDRTQLEQQLAQAGIDLGGGGLDLRHGGLPRERAADTPKTTGSDGVELADATAEVTVEGQSQRPATDSLIDIIA
ncbi:flagellar hook-length control protein FliK [Belnapia moabensis]|uniref:flagellar hook-length control protein FliK n=1 Tax=Belnapia moabensis TaxID=365533 RepID=UPI00146FE880|nr:flagellar hook-length control protein FliK [Belnapia moabensis]